MKQRHSDIIRRPAKNLQGILTRYQPELGNELTRDLGDELAVSSSGVEKHPLRSLAEQPIPVLFRNEVEAVSYEAD